MPLAAKTSICLATLPGGQRGSVAHKDLLIEDKYRGAEGRAEFQGHISEPPRVLTNIKTPC